MTQEVLDFCAEKGIAPQIEVISGQQINQAWDDVVSAKARYRYVIDTSTFWVISRVSSGCRGLRAPAPLDFWAC